MKYTTLITSSLFLVPLLAVADMQSQQALALSQQLAGQIDVIQNNVDDHAARLTKLERGNGGETASLNARIAALEASNAELRRKLDAMRSEIVADLLKRIKSAQLTQTPVKSKPVVTGPCKEYTVQGGDTLSLVAEAFGTKVSVIKEMNGLKNDNLRIGQKLLVPAK